MQTSGLNINIFPIVFKRTRGERHAVPLGYGVADSRGLVIVYNSFTLQQQPARRLTDVDYHELQSYCKLQATLLRHILHVFTHS